MPSYIKKLLLLEGIGKPPTHPNGTILAYPRGLIFLVNMLFVFSIFISIIYSVKIKSYTPIFLNIILTYTISRLPILIFIQPRYQKEKRISIYWLIVIIVILFITTQLFIV